MTHIWLQKLTVILQIHKLTLQNASTLIILPKGQEGCRQLEGQEEPPRPVEGGLPAAGGAAAFPQYDVVFPQFRGLVSSLGGLLTAFKLYGKSIRFILQSLQPDMFRKKLR